MWLGTELNNYKGMWNLDIYILKNPNHKLVNSELAISIATVTNLVQRNINKPFPTDIGPVNKHWMGNLKLGSKT